MATTFSAAVKNLNIHPRLTPVKLWSEDGAEETVFMVLGMATFILAAIVISIFK